MGGKPGGCTKVNELHLIITRRTRILYEHDVFRLDINVRDTNRVKIADASQQAENDVLNDVTFTTDTTPLLVINVEMQSRMEFLKKALFEDA